MGKVLKAESPLVDAWVKIDLGSDHSDLWVTFDLGFLSAGLALWVAGGETILVLNDPTDAFAVEQLSIDSAGWDALGGFGNVPPPTAGASQLLELHRVNGGEVKLYVDGTIVFTGSDTGFLDCRYIYVGLVFGTYDADSVVYVGNFKVGTSRGASNLFAWLDTETDLTDWTATSGLVSVVDDPFGPPPPPAAEPVTRVKVAFTDGPLEVDPEWTDLADLPGVRVQEWSLERGRRDELSKTGAGTANVRLIDENGVFDPNNGASDLFPNVLPDKQILIELYDPVEEEWQTRFRGTVEEWGYALGPTEQWFTVTVTAVDAFGWLNDHQLEVGDGDTLPPEVAAGNIFYEDTAGTVDDRILAILADVDWPSGLASIFSGNVRVQETIYPVGTEALAALFDAADAEFPGVANLYADREGILTFHGRQARFRPAVAAYGIRKQDVGDPSATESDDTICPIAELEFALGKTMIANSVSALPQGVAEADVAGQLVEDATSITAHGKKSESWVDLLTLEGVATGNDALQETLLFATYYVDNYKDPLVRISRMVFKTREPNDRLAGPLWHMLCRSDISDLLTVITTHPGGGGFASEGYYIDGLRQTCRPANPRVPHVELELDVSPKALFDTNPFDADTDPA